MTLLAVAQNKIQVSVDCACNDYVGRAYDYDLKQELARSSVFQYNPNIDGEGLGLRIVSMSDQTDSNNNQSAAVAAVLLMKTKDQPAWFLNEYVVHVGREKTSDLAHQLVVSVNNIADELRKWANTAPAPTSSPSTPSYAQPVTPSYARPIA